jgi:hypothetical protein
MNPVVGLVLVPCSLALVAIAVWGVRPRSSTPWFVTTLGVAGVGLGIGALCFQHDVGTISWFLAPIVMAVLTIAHTTALVAGDGPLRT